jgi:hypothetical protein
MSAIGCSWRHRFLGMDSSKRDQAMFWVAAAGVFAVLGGIPFAFVIAQNGKSDLFSSGWFLVGIGAEIVAAVLLWWAITLALAHAHMAGHVAMTGTPTDAPTPMRIAHVEQLVNVHGSIGTISFAASSNTLIFGPEQEGVLFARGTINRREWAEHLRFSDAWGAQIAHTGDVSFVPPELLEKPPGSSTD